MNTNIKVTKTLESRINEVDFNNIPFGRVFSDHMFEVDYKDGKWQNPRIVPFGPLALHPATSALHYGQAIFEGMKAYKGENGVTQIFRPEENWKRMNRSANRMAMPEVPHEYFIDAVRMLLELDEQWVPNVEGGSLYIRPYMFATDDYVGIKASDNYKFVIFTCPVLAYYSHPVKVLISDDYTRAFPGGTGAAKTAGNYAATLYPVNLAREKGYDQILWTDGIEHKYLQEIGTMNVFAQIGDKVVTPKLSGTILEGITRDSVITILRDAGVTVEERDLTVDEVVEAQKNGTLLDLFGSGTAATISHISHFGYKDTMYELPPVEERKYSNLVKEELNAIKLGQKPDTRGWLYTINTEVEAK